MTNWFNKIFKKIDKTTNFYLFKKRFYIILSVIFIAGFGALFYYNRLIVWGDNNYVVDDSLFANFGQFLSGTLGVIFAIIGVILMVLTFNRQMDMAKRNSETNDKLQRELAENTSRIEEQASANRDSQLKQQRFNDLFFELLHLYQRQVDRLEINEIYNKEGEYTIGMNGLDLIPVATTIEVNGHVFKTPYGGHNKYTGKDFFSYSRIILLRQINSQSESIFVDYGMAKKLYEEFYFEHQTKLGSYFRTLYRIYDLISKTEINERIKKDYLKIIRAQLSIDELLFLRYNAATIFGEKFIKYINDYNILKHLPVLHLLEFKKFNDLIQDVNARHRLNYLFFELIKELKELLSEGLNYENRKFKPKDKYIYMLNYISESKIKVVLVKWKNRSYYSDIRFKSLNQLCDEDIKKLLNYFLREIFIYRNYMRYNNNQNLRIETRIYDKSDRVVFVSSITGLSNHKLKLKTHHSSEQMDNNHSMAIDQPN